MARLISLSFLITASLVGNCLAVPLEATPASSPPISTPTTMPEQVLLPTRVWMGDKCAEKCREMWGWRGHVFGSNPWGDVVFSGEPGWLDFTRPESNSTTSTSTSTSTSTTPLITSTSATQTITPSEAITSVRPTVTTTSSRLSVARGSQTLTKTRPAQTLPTLEVVRPTRTKVGPTSTARSSSTRRTSTRTTSTRTTTTRARRPAPTPPPREDEEDVEDDPEEEPEDQGEGGDLGVQNFNNGDIGEYLRNHNEARRRHGADPVTWSFDLQSKAQQWADNCQFEHSGGIFGRVGENLAAGTGSGFSIQAMIKAWVDEVVDYNPSNPQGSHFTQVVWKDTREIGCAVQTCNNIFPGSAARFYVCEYLPAGNVGGQFDQNVQK